jgi:hypothetical protein
MQLILKGLDSIYVPGNPVLHIAREESLSRSNAGEIKLETRIMKSLYRKLIEAMVA